MSVFDKIDPNDILLEKYECRCYNNSGEKYLSPINWVDYEDYFVNLEAAWNNWIYDRRASINYQWKINITRLSKSAWLNALKKEIDSGRIKTLLFRGTIYYNESDLRKFHKNYELMVVWRYCRRNHLPWDGYEKVILTNAEQTESYEYIQRN